MVNLLTTRDKAVKNELSNEVAELLKVSNEKICGDVIEYLQINLLPLKTNIDLLVDSQQSIKLDIGHIKNEIAGVRQQVKNIETENNNVHGEIKLIIDTLDKRTKTWKLWVWAVIIIGISVTLTFLLF
jgi:chromosome segregation ATPase